MDREPDIGLLMLITYLVLRSYSGVMVEVLVDKTYIRMCVPTG